MSPLPKTPVEICPQCGEHVVQPRDSEEYCEECGWPEENVQAMASADEKTPPKETTL